MSKKLSFLFVVMVVAIQLAAQQQIDDPNAQVRTVKGYHAIKVSDGIDLFLSPSNEEVVVVSASQAKHRDRIRTVVENGVLKIFYDDEGWSWWSTGNKRMKAYVSFKSLDRLTASGASDVRVNGTIKSNKLNIRISGASDFRGAIEVGNLIIDQSGASDAEITGSAGSVDVEVSGASNLKGFNLQAESCRARASGASDIKITVSKQLNASASGASDISYKGQPEVIERRSSGSSSIKKS